jgi:hypothetical protein
VYSVDSPTWEYQAVNDRPEQELAAAQYAPSSENKRSVTMHPKGLPVQVIVATKEAQPDVCQ